MNQLIGARIKTAREAANISQYDLAVKVGFKSATAISLIESGERGLSSQVLSNLSIALHRSIGYFMGHGDTDETIDVQVALRADKDLSQEDKEAISRFIELAKSKNNGK
jgi:transcriptional regulator with XRE-family HTH domain